MLCNKSASKLQYCHMDVDLLLKIEHQYNGGNRTLLKELFDIKPLTWICNAEDAPLTVGIPSFLFWVNSVRYMFNRPAMSLWMAESKLI